jgi:2-methylaconitate cis-trans-isomerase PrpF
VSFLEFFNSGLNSVCLIIPISFFARSYHMRGGTSTGCVIWHEHLPSPSSPDQLELREEAIRGIMGVPQKGDYKGNNQITGLGRGIATSNKVCLSKSING